MAKANLEWVAVVHGPIEKLEENLWRVEGDMPDGGPMKRVFTIVRLGDGRLIFHSAIALDEAAMKELEAWGKPAFLIVPGERHRLDAPAYKRRYPELKVVCPPGARDKVAEVIAVDQTDGDFGDPNVGWEPLDGMAGRECVLLVRSAGGVTLVFNDIIMNMRRGTGFGGFVLRLLGTTGTEPKVTPLARMFLVKDRSALRAHLERLAATPGLRRIVVSHGAPFAPAALP